MSETLPGVSVVIVNYHTPEAIDTALAVLLDGSALELDVIVVDQEPSQQETEHHGRWSALPNVRVVQSSVNLGFAGGCNLGADSAIHPWLLFLNSDAWMTQEHATRLLRAAVENDALAAGPLSNRASDVQTMYTWDATKRFRSPAAYLEHEHPESARPFAYHRLSGVCLLVRADAFEAVGRFERSYGLGYFEDDELTVRLARRGPIIVVPSSFVHHQDGLSWRNTGRHERHLAMYVNRIRYLYRNCTAILDQPDERPLVSVIVTTFNRPELLERALASIAAQTYLNLEVVVVNDAGIEVRNVVERALGTDAVKSWQYLANVENLGKPACINRGLTAASGELIAHLDDDDEFLPDHLLAAVNVLTRHPSLDAVYFGAISRKVNKDDKTVHREVVSHEWDVMRILVVNYVPNCALVHRRTLIDLTGPYLELNAIEDWDFLRRASLVGRFLHVPLVTTTFRVRTDGGSRNGLAKRSFESYMSTERMIRVGAPHLAAAPSVPPAAWTDLIERSKRPPYARDQGRLINLGAASGLAEDCVGALRPDIFEAHLRQNAPTVESAYAALLAAAGLQEQTAALAALIVHYLGEGNLGAATRLHGFLSYVTSGTELTGSGSPLATGRRVFEREGLRGMRELAVLSAKRRLINLMRRLRGA